MAERHRPAAEAPMATSRPDNEAIFHDARDIPDPGRRREYVREACGGDETRIAHLEALLAAANTPDSLLDRPAESDSVATIEQPITASPGSVIGPYKLVEQIGEGGMGTVWMAQQAEPVKRLVAVKLIKAGMDSRQVVARFEAERQTLALMDHPNIARVLDGGTTGAGRPYFVMDLVKGVPITRYCDEHRLTPRQRLELFLPVCQAVQHAHQKGVIHRDLKPSNVLVAPYDGQPVPKVIDFGVAKAAGQSLTEKTLVTGFGAIVGTLEYMSPEQAELNNLDIDTRSDVYSLGVLLYELLAGTPPFTRKESEPGGMVEMLRVIREQEPTKPSAKLSTAEGLPTLAANRGTEPTQLTKLVRGELDWIVMKALEKDRNRRYETANGFAADVQRYLADEPVLACPPSAWYRLRKFARRNKGGLAAAVLVLFFLVLLGIGVGWAVRDRTARQSRTGAQVDLILGDVEHLEKEQKWPEALVAARRAEAAVTGGEADAATARRVRDRVRGLEFIDRIEQTRMERATPGNLDYAGRNGAYARAFRDYGVDVEELPIEESIERLKARPALAIPLAAALDDWVFLRRQALPSDATDWQRLVAVARGIDPDPLRDRLRSSWGRPIEETQDELRRLADSIDVRTHHPATLGILASTLLQVKQFDSAVRVMREAQSVYPGDYWLNIKLGVALGFQKDPDGLRYLTAAVAIRPNSAHAYCLIGLVCRAQGKLPEAAGAFRRATELDPTSSRFHNLLGMTLHRQGKLPEAIAAYRRVVALNPKYPGAYADLASALNSQKKFDEAIPCYGKAIEIDPNSPSTHNELAWILATCPEVGLRDSKRSVPLAKRAVELKPEVSTFWNTLGAAHYRAGDWKEAVAALQKSMELRNGGDAFDWFFLAMARRRIGEKDKAREWYDRAVQWMAKNQPTNEELRRFRAEAAELLELNEKK
jgi:serine/threonine protein kinase/Flp pilus assembly protein TadD